MKSLKSLGALLLVVITTCEGPQPQVENPATDAGETTSGVNAQVGVAGQPVDPGIQEPDLKLEAPVVEGSLSGDFDGDGLRDDLLRIREDPSSERFSTVVLMGNGDLPGFRCPGLWQIVIRIPFWGTKQ